LTPPRRRGTLWSSSAREEANDGARRLPEIGSGLGKAIKNFKSGVSEKGEIDVTPEKKEVSEEAN
jgi:hypothetical protein